MLESLHETDIKHLSIEQPEGKPEGWFEMPELNSDDLLEISKLIKERRKNSSALAFVNTVNELGIPEAITEEDILRAKSYLNMYRDQNMAFEMSFYACALAEADVDPNLTSEDMDMLTRGLQKNQSEKRALARNLKVLGGNPKVTDRQMEDMKLNLDTDREVLLWGDFAVLARLIHETGLDVKIYPEDIRGMQDYLKSLFESLRDKTSVGWTKFLYLASNMKYLSDHPSISSPKIGVQDQQPPEQRNF